MDIYRSNENLMSSYTGGLRLWSVLILGDSIKGNIEEVSILIDINNVIL